MKAISIKQPWAWAVVHGGKDIENRTWSTPYRGEIAIHATSIDAAAVLPAGVAAPPVSELALGAVLGVVELVDVVRSHASVWFRGPVGFVLAKPRPLRIPIRCRGDQRIWTLPEAVEQAVRRDRSITHAPSPPSLVASKTASDIKKKRGRAGTRWTATDDALLLQHWQQGRTAEDIAELLQRGPFSVEVRLCKLGTLPRTPVTPDLGKRQLTVTQGNLTNSHLYLTDALDLFPPEVLGGPDESQAGRPVRVHYGNSVVETDVVRDKNIFRRRGWLRDFFEANRIAAGDRILLERLDASTYRVSRSN